MQVRQQCCAMQKLPFQVCIQAWDSSAPQRKAATQSYTAVTKYLPHRKPIRDRIRHRPHRSKHNARVLHRVVRRTSTCGSGGGNDVDPRALASEAHHQILYDTRVGSDVVHRVTAWFKVLYGLYTCRQTLAHCKIVPAYSRRGRRARGALHVVVRDQRRWGGAA
jgi:hypothetical protein